ncbi:MAG: hypothetical protein M1834_002413 [Cirrosporium novae-zelandiae]|nr:MAG: hypothetical protein M1834_002413 [Cirrosporium novae-zelandiae]
MASRRRLNFDSYTIEIPQHNLGIGMVDFSAEFAMTGVYELWEKTLSATYPITKERLTDLLTRDHGRHFAALLVTDPSDWREWPIIGFIATYMYGGGGDDGETRNGYISVIMVDPVHQRKGLGSAMVEWAQHMLYKKYGIEKLPVGSVFPRFWPGVPKDLSKNALEFFENEGTMEPENDCIDLYQDITNYKAPVELVARAEKEGYTFHPLHPSQFSECLVGQRKNFSSYTGWVSKYEDLHHMHRDFEIMTCFTPTGQQVGWTLMTSCDSPILQDFAFTPVVGPKTGVVACVGVDEGYRNKGIGLAMLVRTLEDMKRRGVEMVFVDWVTMRGYYEKVGFETWRGYLGCGF